LRQDGDEGYKWIKAKTGDYLHVPSNSRHAWRNVSNKPTLVHIITTKKLGHFFEETGRPETNLNNLLSRLEILEIIELNDQWDISIGQKEYIETKSGAGMASSSRIICEYCDKGKHNECNTVSKCYCAKNGHRML